MKDRFERTLFYLVVQIILFGLPPLLCAMYGAPMQIYMLLPPADLCMALIAGFFFGKKNGADWLMSICSTVVFLPTGLFFYPGDAVLFIVGVFVCSLIGVLVGSVYRRRVR